MIGTTLHKTAADRAQELPGARLEHPFGDDWEVFKVRGKVFMLMTEVPGGPVVILKADPGEAHALREQYSHITPGYHMNKKHWITLEGGDGVGPEGGVGPEDGVDTEDGVDEELVDELVTDSYRLVVARLPRAERPVDPHTYGSRTWAAR
ncbi:MmcQ/YjbR family DNA-binding protein [Streptomyces sp. NPDC002138]|uniref:MmcQ/YjbR family DNA-binding protein n=1 Tax=Streptomyces sp. NPDC002138 TaxID=3154410 RepID=UPI00332669C2